MNRSTSSAVQKPSKIFDFITPEKGGKDLFVQTSRAPTEAIFPTTNQFQIHSHQRQPLPAEYFQQPVAAAAASAAEKFPSPNQALVKRQRQLTQYFRQSGSAFRQSAAAATGTSALFDKPAAASAVAAAKAVEAAAHEWAVTRNARGPNKWNDKRPDIRSDWDSAGNQTKVIYIQGKAYELGIKKLGREHFVYFFKNNETIQYNRMTLATDNYVLRILNSGVFHSKRISEKLEQEVNIYQQLLRDRVPLPKCGIRPDSFIDETNPQNGGFWLLEKIEEPVDLAKVVVNGQISEMGKKVLDFVKQQFLLILRTGQEYIFDLKPDNFMLKNGNFYFVDFTKAPNSDASDNDYRFNIQNDLCKWCEGVNEEDAQIIHSYLTAEFSKDWNGQIRKEFRFETIQEKIAAKHASW